MESTDLYSVKQRFYLGMCYSDYNSIFILTSFEGAYKSLVEQSLPNQSSEDYIPILFYKTRAHIALGDTETATSLIPEDTENLALKAVAVFANYVASQTGDAALEELRDLCVEIEGDDVDASEREKGWVRVVAGTAFARAGEVEEALESLGAESTTENLEAYVPINMLFHMRD